MRSLVRPCVALIVSLFAASSSTAQEFPGYRPVEAVAAPGESRPAAQNEPRPITLPGNARTAEDESERRWHSRLELALTLGTLAFGAFVLGMLGWFLGKGFLPADVFLKLFVLVIVVTAGLFVVVAGYTQDQIAPMMGLLGTLVGYLLGREASRAAAKAGETPA